MATITATPVPGSALAPAGIRLDIAGAALPPTTAYTSNFSAGTDSWSASGFGVAMTNDTSRNPDALKLQGMTGTHAGVSASRTISGLTVGFVYRFSMWAETINGQFQMTASMTDGTEVAAGSWTYASPRAYAQLEFTATATSHVIEVAIRIAPEADPRNRAYSFLDSIRVDPTSLPALYSSDFTVAPDGWTASGTGSHLDVVAGIDPPGMLWLYGVTSPPGTVGAVISASKTVTGLAVGTQYVMRATLTRNDPTGGNTRLRCSTGDATPYVAVPVGSNQEMVLEFTATATSHVVAVDQQRTSTANKESVFIFGGITVAPTWQTTRIYRTDVNGTDVPVRNPNHVEPSGTGGLTIMDYESAMIGEVSYTVTDGVGGTAQGTVSTGVVQSNRATNPIAAGVPSTTPWIGGDATLSVVASNQIRATITNAYPDDMRQKITSPHGGLPPNQFVVGEYQPGDAFRASVWGRCSMQDIAGQVVVPQTLVGPMTTFSSGVSSHLNLTSPPMTGDVILYNLIVLATSLQLTDVSGCGASWSLAFPEQSANGFISSWWIGTGANTIGAISQTLTSGKNGRCTAWLIRGLTSTNIAHTLAQTGGTATLTTTPMNAQSGQIVLSNLWISDNSYNATYPNPAVPSAGWVVGTGVGQPALGARNWAYRLPTETTPTSHTLTATYGGATGMAMESIVVGTGVPFGPRTPQLRSKLEWYNSSGVSIGATLGPIVTVNDTVFSELRIDTTVPALAHYVRIEVAIPGTGPRSVGDWIEMNRVLLGRPGNYFDGTFATTEDYAYDWESTPHFSPSRETSIARDPDVDIAPSLTLPATALLASNLSPPQFSPLTMALDYDETTDSAVAVHTVLGRSTKLSNPAPMLARAGSLTLFCQNYEEARAVRELLKFPQTAMFRQADFKGLDLYFVARQVQIAPEQPTPVRRWLVVINYDEVPRPP